MSNTDDATAKKDEPVKKRFNGRVIYLKDLSFEAPNTIASLAGDWKPLLDVSLRTKSRQLSAQDHEVVLSLTVTARNDDNVTAYLIEAHQAGIFTLTGFNDDELKAQLGIHCPEYLYPFACEAASSYVRKGGFPKLVLAPVNFESMYNDSINNKSE